MLRHFVNSNIKKLIKAAILQPALATLVIAGGVNGQEQQPGKLSDKRAALVNDCEPNRDRLDDIHSAAGKEGLIILVARLGDGEKLRSLNNRRLHNALVYLNEFLLRPMSTIIVTQGERVTGRGRVEIYVGGKLIDAFGMKTGEDFFLGTCEWGSEADKNLYDSRRTKKRTNR